jgi:hypothetical protein
VHKLNTVILGLDPGIYKHLKKQDSRLKTSGMTELKPYFIRANALCAISIHFPSCPKVFIGHPGAKELDSRLQTAGMTFPMLFFLIHNCFFV